MPTNTRDTSTPGGIPDETLADLQMRITYQEDEIRHLVQEVERQRAAIDSLHREVARLKNLVAALTPAQVGDQEDETPPHY